MRRFACWEVAATAVRRVARSAVRPRIAKVMVEVGRRSRGGVWRGLLSLVCPWGVCTLENNKFH
jgi:hypothetical protein